MTTNPYDPSSLYSYPGWPAWVPSTSLMVLPMGGLGAAGGAGGLGASRLMSPSEVLQPGKLYTYRTYSLVPLVENATFGGFFSRNTAWGNHRGTLNILQPPGTVRSLYQASAAEPYTGRAAEYRGRNVYNTSLTFSPQRGGVTVSQAKVAALNILNQMREDFADDQAMKIFEGNLYERGVQDTPAAAPSIIDRVREVITGEDPAEAARRRTMEAEASQRETVLMVVAGLAALGLGIFLSTRKGSAKLERRFYGAATSARSEARGAAGAALGLQGNRRRRRNAKIQRDWGTGWLIVVYSRIGGDSAAPHYYRFDTREQAEQFGRAQAKKYGDAVVVKRENYKNRQGEKEFF